MSIRLNEPYKIIAYKHERYEAHYQIPSSAALVVPTLHVGDEVACDVRWENENGELKVLHKKMFIAENLVRLDPLADKGLFEIWQHYYGSGFEELTNTQGYLLGVRQPLHPITVLKP
jgi:hypothetical protein